MKITVLTDDDLIMILNRMNLKVISQETDITIDCLKKFKYTGKMTKKNKEDLSGYLRLMSIHLTASLARGRTVEQDDEYTIPDDYDYCDGS